MTRPLLHASALSALLALTILACGDDEGRPSAPVGGPRDSGSDGGDGDGDMDASQPDARPTELPDSNVEPPDPRDADSDATEEAPPTPVPDAGGDASGDATVEDCEEDCSALSTECTIATCDPDSLECVFSAVPNGTECGDDTLDACTAPDICMNGVCEPRHAVEGTACGDQNVVCRVNDTCDGEGNCDDNGLAEVGEPCGSQDSNECDNPNSCDELGLCNPRYVEADAPCGDQDELCRNNDRCNGSGQCIDQGSWQQNACPVGVLTHTDGRCICGRFGTYDVCLPGPDVCVGGECIPGEEQYAPSGGTTDGTACGEQTPSDPECDQPDVCEAGECSPNPVPEFTACGSSSSNPPCDAPDSCDGGGSCDPRYASNAVVCGPQAGECLTEARCNGIGACGAALDADFGTPCGDETANGVCDEPDVCDGEGACDSNPVPLNVPCGDVADGPCDLNDACDGEGACEDRIMEPGTVCGDADVDCVEPDTCDDEGACIDNGFSDPGTSCGNQNERECDDADTCNGAGGCEENTWPVGSVCESSTNACTLAECDESFDCVDQGPIEGCEHSVTGTVVDFDTGMGLEGIEVEVPGGSSTITDEQGNFTLGVPLDEDFLVYVHPDASHWGSALPQHLTIANDSIGIVALFPNALIDAITDVPELPAPSVALGVLLVEYQGASGAGGESVALSPSCASDSCGPIVLGPEGPVVSPELLAGGEALQIFIDLPIAGFDITPSGASGVNDCTLRYPGTEWQALAHTVTFAYADCEEL